MNPVLPSPEEIEQLSLYDLISLFDDLQTPEPISYYPVTPIWAWIVSIAALLALYLLFKAWKRWQRERYRTIACDELARIASIKGPAYAMKVSQILKWTALAAYPRRLVASLKGEQWLRFLDSTFEGSEFTEGVGQSLAASQYQRTADFNEDVLGVLAKKWIRTHRRGVF